MSQHKPGSRERYSTWLSEETLQIIKDNYKDDDCFTQGEYIEKAVQFYSSYRESEEPSEFLSITLISIIRNILNAAVDRQNKMLFKVAVELAVLSNVIASVEEIPIEQISRLRVECIKEVKGTNDIMDFEKAKGWQSE